MTDASDASEERRLSHFAEDFEESDADSDVKPLPRPYIPSRAWLSPSMDQSPEDGGDPEDWSGHYDGGNDDWHFDAEGTFDELLRRAEEAGVEEYRIWSPSQKTFVVVEERPARPVP